MANLKTMFVSFMVLWLAFATVATGADSAFLDSISVGTQKEVSAEINEKLERLRKEIRERKYSHTVGYSSAMEFSLEQLCGFVIPDDWKKMGTFKRLKPVLESLPRRFDWRDQEVVPPIRDQGGCGSCWAFATVAPMETAIERFYATNEDISEQYLVSCNTDGWGCEGGFWAHDYHQWKIPPSETEAGAVLEAEFPYEAKDLSCCDPNPCPKNHPYSIESWAYIDTEETIPTVEELKQAIFDYGIVSVAVKAGDQFQGYKSGVFEVDEPGDPNHAVVLTGWDDDQGTNGIWFLRNSWDTDWGENGYMRIGYGMSQIGFAASFIEFSESLIADFEGEPRSGGSPLTVKFIDKSTGEITGWYWEFGDGHTSIERNPEHTYTDIGYYDVSLTVYSNDAQDTKTKEKYIEVTHHIIAAEYYIDSDPGEGEGIPLPPKDGAFDNNFEEIDFEIILPELLIGQHVLYVRMQNEVGTWGISHAVTFMVTGFKNVIGAEYFIDNDPGKGLGKPLNPSDGLFDDPEEEIELSGIDTSFLSMGMHVIWVRMQSSEGVWGQPRRFQINISNPSYIAEAEYFVDEDPGQGEGIRLDSCDGDFDEREEDLEIELDTTDISIGAHVLYVRAKDSYRRWGTPMAQEFEVTEKGCDGDVNGDGEITPQDALCAFQTYLGICPTSCDIPCEDICCDVTQDADCTPADALEIFKEYLGLPSVCSP